MNRKRGPKRVRATIHVYPEVLAAYQEMANITGDSLARTIGDWLWQTAEAAGAMTTIYGGAKSMHGRQLASVFERVAFYQRHVDELEREGKLKPAAGSEIDALVESRRRPASPAQPANRPATVSALKTPRAVIRGDSVPNSGHSGGEA